MMKLVHDPAPAAWLRWGRADWWTTVTIGPAGFEAYARLRMIPDPTHPGQGETDLDLPDDHPSDLDQILRAVNLLTPATTTPDDAYACLWEGWPWDDAVRASWGDPVVGDEFRRHHFFHGALDDLETLEEITRDAYPPAVIWPADRAWCVTFDVDPHWAGIAGTREALAPLVEDPLLDVVLTERDAPHPLYF